MKYIINPILTFMFLVFIIAFIFIFGFMIGISAEMHNTQFMTEKVQDQFWEIQESELDIREDRTMNKGYSIRDWVEINDIPVLVTIVTTRNEYEEKQEWYIDGEKKREFNVFNEELHIINKSFDHKQINELYYKG